MRSMARAAKASTGKRSGRRRVSMRSVMGGKSASARKRERRWPALGAGGRVVERLVFAASDRDFGLGSQAGVSFDVTSNKRFF